MSRTLIAGLALLLCFGVAAEAALKLGEVLPDFKMKDTDGKEHALSGWLGTKEKPGPYKLVVLVFWDDRCPYTVRTDPLVEKTWQEVKDKGVLIVGVCAKRTGHPQWTSDETVNAYRKSKSLSFPVLRDPEAKLAKQLGARTTPHVFVFDAEAKLAHAGGPCPPRANEPNFLKEAVDELLAGKKVSRQSRNFG